LGLTPNPQEDFDPPVISDEELKRCRRGQWNRVGESCTCSGKNEGHHRAACASSKESSVNNKGPQGDAQSKKTEPKAETLSDLSSYSLDSLTFIQKQASSSAFVEDAEAAEEEDDQESTADGPGTWLAHEPRSE